MGPFSFAKIPQNVLITLFPSFTVLWKYWDFDYGLAQLWIGEKRAKDTTGRSPTLRSPRQPEGHLLSSVCLFPFYFLFTPFCLIFSAPVHGLSLD